MSAKTYFTLRNWLILLLPSTIGVYLFMWPVGDGAGLTIPVAALAAHIRQLVGLWMP